MGGAWYFKPMFGKILITAVVVVLAWLAIRARSRGVNPTRAAPATPARPPLVPPGAMRTIAYGMVGVMVAGTGLYLFDGWESGREAVRVRVINANTGQVAIYRARRDQVAGRSFRTLDGRQITLAEVERMELEPERPEPTR